MLRILTFLVVFCDLLFELMWNVNFMTRLKYKYKRRYFVENQLRTERETTAIFIKKEKLKLRTNTSNKTNVLRINVIWKHCFCSELFGVITRSNGCHDCFWVCSRNCKDIFPRRKPCYREQPGSRLKERTTYVGVSKMQIYSMLCD